MEEELQKLKAAKEHFGDCSVLSNAFPSMDPLHTRQEQLDMELGNTQPMTQMCSVSVCFGRHRGFGGHGRLGNNAFAFVWGGEVWFGVAPRSQLTQSQMRTAELEAHFQVEESNCLWRSTCVARESIGANGMLDAGPGSRAARA